MATVTPSQSPGNLDQDRTRIRSPLTRLRKYIHTYVSLEGLATIAVFVALWFWIGLLLDYGIFKLTLIDWVQTLPWGARATVLTAVLAGLAALVATRILFRLFREFSDPAMALVLERRFPEQLGDRLITAVEMSDPQAAAEYGYSPTLVKQTIHEAAERVDQVPVGQVFDWKRLVRQGVRVVVLTLGLGLLVGGGFCAYRSYADEGSPMEGYSDFGEVAGIWAERNVLLRNTIWPRKSYLEVLPWDRARVEGEKSSDLDAHELRIPQGSTPPNLRVRAWKYVMSASDSTEGWRLLTWADLKARPDFVGGETIPELPETWEKNPRDREIGLTVDEVELLLEAFPVRLIDGRWEVGTPGGEWEELRWSDLTREKLGGLEVPAIPGAWDPKAMPAAALASGLIKGDPLAAAARAMIGPKFISLSVAEIEEKLKADEQQNKPQPAVRAVLNRLRQYAGLRGTLEAVSVRASDREMRRTLRKLIVPDTVLLSYYGLQTKSPDNRMTRIAGNEFLGTFAELKESVTYSVRGEDYVTPLRRITVVERPRVESLRSDEERPAYLYYRTSGEVTAADLRGKRQPLESMNLSVSGDTTTFEVPAGTYVTLRATITKPLKSFSVAVEQRDQKTFRAEKPTQIDERTFQIVLPDVRREQRFRLVFEDTDEVVGERKVVLQPREDLSPRVREFNPDEVIRRGRGSEGFIIAAGCRIPFKGRVLDDHGLGRVRYACRVLPSDFLSEQKVRALLGVGGVTLFGPSSNGPMQMAAYLTTLGRELASSKAEDAGPEQYYDLPAFAVQMAANRPGEGQDELLGRETLLGRLATKQREPYRKLFREFQLTPDTWVDRLAEDLEDNHNPSRWFKANEARSPLNNDLPLWKLTWRDRDGKDRPIQDPDDTKPQKRFQIEVRLLVEDTYLDGDLDGKTKQPLPHVSPSGETFTFMVVPENELLARIAEEEEIKYRELQKAFKPLPENLDRMRDLHFALAGGPSGLDANILSSFVARCDSLSEVLKTSQQDVKSVFVTYERILREMRMNQVREDILTKVYRTIYVPLEQVADTQFDRTYNAVIALRRTLDTPGQSVPQRVEASAPRSAEARKQLNDLVAQLNAILAAMEGLSKLNELIAELARIEKQEEDLESLVSRLLKARIKEELEKLND